ncbi:DEAD/DEAH box helicase [Paraburkholderia caribensis]|uniref:DEAD/DEAH box helicase n=1 Tax=Paraburkholderia caribensis TaxID=75105 RepID=UPI0007C6B414|nr:DEAD/DEAH box helicase [Paraburkholderia caribensis]
MRPEAGSRRLFGITQAKARMFEYAVPRDHYLAIPPGTHPEDLFLLTIGILGDEAGALCDQYEQGATLVAASVPTDRQGLRFAASFFHAYVAARFDDELDDEVLTLAAASFYLAETPGSSVVISNLLAERGFQVDDPLATVLRYVLANRLTDAYVAPEYRFSLELRAVLAAASELLTRVGGDERILLRNTTTLRRVVYARGSAREVALVDVCVATILRKASNSSRLNLPRYSRLDDEAWLDVFLKRDFVSELWPSQRLLGESGVFAGASAVVQMPTSAGKTRAVELVIRSAILANNARTAVVVAPFRALCHEISMSLRQAFAGEPVSIDELSDVLQQDFMELLAELLGEEHQPRPQVLVLTPEKFLYILRQSPELAEKIGLVIYDEGHQFDSGARGVTYELLLTTLKRHLPRKAQIILVSAVISNGEVVGRWLLGERSRVARGEDLAPTQRSVAFASWKTALGTLQFNALGLPEDFPYFVPRIIESVRLPLRGRERRNRVFPEKDDAADVALYLGLKLAPQGSSAIFCGRKDSAAAIVARAVEYFSRGVPFDAPSAVADADELRRLVQLHVKHFGGDAVVTMGARLGILAHHGNTPQGLRVCIEHAIKESLAPLVVCTSTLAQGVNLPLRYLIVSSIYQGGERVKVRDFHNLMGRAGRAGMHIEGSVIFADTRVFDDRDSRQRRNRWRWDAVRELLDARNVEPTGSSLLSLVEPIMNDDGSEQVQNAFDVVVALLADEDNTLAQINDDPVYLRAVGATPEAVARQVKYKARLLNAVASFLQASRGDEEFERFLQQVEGLAESTLAFMLASGDQKDLLKQMFVEVARAVHEREPDTVAQRRNSRTLLGLNALAKIYRWCEDHRDDVLAPLTQEQLLSTIWPLLEAISEDELFAKCIGKEQLEHIAQLWLSGEPYYRIEEEIHRRRIAKRHGAGQRRFTPGDVVDICDNCFGYEFSLYLTALVTFFEREDRADYAPTIELLKQLQSGLKYGLPDALLVAIHEAGFSDRMLVQDLRPTFIAVEASRTEVARRVRNAQIEVLEVLQHYPLYFESVLDSIVEA